MNTSTITNGNDLSQDQGELCAKSVKDSLSPDHHVEVQQY
ncbi:12800_t:CDS:2 [Funneliformis caledonium]|uniref:12800_t:CDS:1 n=1 Tax=Funneliformis caledonium TaxID=1117310 RepID=A0A9N9CTT6_9GLOM|nr:12800_t:CDS:2 [Funneliformis caledonium]